MATNASILKIDLEISDMDRHYYATHALTLAKHPSETDERVMIRVLAFALNAHPALQFGRGLSAEDEPDLWQRDDTGLIERWIEVGQPDEADLRRACGRAREVLVYTYSGRGAQLWWDKNAAALARCRNLRVIDVPAEASASLAALAARKATLQCLVQDGHVQVIDDTRSVEIEPTTRQAPHG